MFTTSFILAPSPHLLFRKIVMQAGVTLGHKDGRRYTLKRLMQQNCPMRKEGHCVCWTRTEKIGSLQSHGLNGWDSI